MNSNATSNQTVRDIVIFLLGAGLTTVVLLVLYFVLPLGKTDSTGVSDDDTPTVAETSEDSPPSPKHSDQTTRIYDENSVADILTNYSGTFDRFAALYSLISQSDEQKLVDLFNESKTYEYSELDESWLQRDIQQTILSRLVHLNEEVASSLFLELESNQQSLISYTLAREWASIDLDSAVDFVTSLADSVQYSATRGVLDLNRTLPIDELRSLADRLGDTKYIQIFIDQSLLEEEAEDPSAAWAKLSANPDLLSDENWRRIDNIVEAWIKEDGITVIDTMTNELEDEDLKERIIRNGLRTVAEDDPEAAFDYALQFESGGGMFGMRFNPYMYSVIDSWVNTQPTDALNKSTYTRIICTKKPTCRQRV